MKSSWYVYANVDSWDLNHISIARMGILSALLAVCAGHPPVTKTVVLLVIWDAMTPMWNCNDCHTTCCPYFMYPWWRHQMETFSALLALYARNSPVTGEFPSQRPVTRSFDVFFDLSLNKRLSKQSWGWWFETSSRPLWRHCNAMYIRYPSNLILLHCVLTWINYYL